MDGRAGVFFFFFFFFFAILLGFFSFEWRFFCGAKMGSSRGYLLFFLEGGVIGCMLACTRVFRCWDGGGVLFASARWDSRVLLLCGLISGLPAGGGREVLRGFVNAMLCYAHEDNRHGRCTYNVSG
jgi:hypothetical protein